MPYAVVARARMSSARPTVAMFRPTNPLAAARGVFGELRRALRDERVALADECRAVLADGHDDLAPLPEGVRHRAGVRHRDRRRAVAVTHAEGQSVRPRTHRAVLHLPGELVGDA